VAHSRLALISESHNAVLGTKENQVNTKTEVKLPATNGIAFSVTPEQAMELISYLASWAKDGKTFDVTVHTQSKGWASDLPVAVVGFGGFQKVNAELQWAYTGNGDNQVIHYDSTKVGA
jgi:hypothetical protein